MSNPYYALDPEREFELLQRAAEVCDEASGTVYDELAQNGVEELELFVHARDRVARPNAEAQERADRYRHSDRAIRPPHQKQAELSHARTVAEGILYFLVFKASTAEARESLVARFAISPVSFESEFRETGSPLDQARVDRYFQGDQ